MEQVIERMTTLLTLRAHYRRKGAVTLFKRVCGELDTLVRVHGRKPLEVAVEDWKNAAVVYAPS